MKIGNACKSRIVGVKAEEIEVAITCCRLLLNEIMVYPDPGSRATTL
jgi:hypothetical protein